MRLGMLIDTRKCVGCMDCVVACQTENRVPTGQRRDWITTTETGRFPKVKVEIRSERCNQCDKPPCVPVCPVGASFVSDFGKLVLVDETKCIKCGMCVSACPYGARFMNEVSGVADKCTFCVHRLKEGKKPACVEVCPAHAMMIGDLDDPKSEIARALKSQKTKVLKPEAGTKPRVFYIA